MSADQSSLWLRNPTRWTHPPLRNWLAVGGSGCREKTKWSRHRVANSRYLHNNLSPNVQESNYIRPHLSSLSLNDWGETNLGFEYISGGRTIGSKMSRAAAILSNNCGCNLFGNLLLPSKMFSPSSYNGPLCQPSQHQCQPQHARKGNTKTVRFEKHEYCWAKYKCLERLFVESNEWAKSWLSDDIPPRDL